MAKRQTERTKPATAELAPAENETDLSFALQVGSAVTAFLKRAAEFFKRADDLEARSKAVLDQAKKLTQPTNSTEDVELQKFIQRCGVGTKTVEAHWDGSDAEPGITKLLHRLHRRVTSRRDVSLKALKEAADIGNRLHNSYTADELRRAEEERRRKQAIEDAKAQKRRDDELAELERIALAREAESDELSERERTFAELVYSGTNPVAAAKAAGYKDPVAQSERLLKSSKVSNAIEAKREAAAVRKQKEAIAAAPIEAKQVEVQPDIARAAGTKEVTRWKAKLTDEAAFIEAVFEGKLGIPRDVLCVDVTRLNQYARDLHTTINRWPGVQAVPDTKVQ